MTTNEYYYDDIVINSDDKTGKASIGLVTRDKPFTPYFKLLKNLENADSTNKTNNKVNNEFSDNLSHNDGDDSNKDESDDGDSSDGNLFDPPQVDSVNVDWFIHDQISNIIDCDDKTYITSIPGKNLSLIDRSLNISDIVKSKINGDVKVGCISNIKVYADVLVLGHNIVLKNVDCSKMKWVEAYMGKHQDYNFSYKNWLGEVFESTVEAIIRFPDGAKMRVPESSLEHFNYLISKIWNLENLMENTIMEGDACNLKTRKSRFILETTKYNAKWLTKLKQFKSVQFIVEKIIPMSVDLNWIYSNNRDTEGLPVSPPTVLKGRELEKLEPIDPFPWYSLTIGDVWYYPISDKDEVYECVTKDTQMLLYKVINGDLQPVNFDAPTAKCESAEKKNQEKEVVSGGGHVLKPRKKVISGAKARSGRKRSSQKPSQAAAKYDDTDSDEESYYSPDENLDKPNQISKKSSPNEQNKKSDKKHDDEAKSNVKSLSNELRQKIFQATHEQNDSNVQTLPYNFPVGILTRCSFVDVDWQDGSVSNNVPICQLLPQTYNIDEHDFFPGDFVIQKFDPQQSQEMKESMHNFGTILESNTKDRVAKVQWFDYCPQVQLESTGNLITSSIIKCGDPVEVGVYDISALNEHHLMVGSQVIIKPESSHKNYPAGYVLKQAAEKGQLIIRWPDGYEEGVSPTELLLTVDSVVGDDDDDDDDSIINPDFLHFNGSDNDSNYSDYITSSDLDSDSAGVEKLATKKNEGMNKGGDKKKSSNNEEFGNVDHVSDDDSDSDDDDDESDWETTDEQDGDPLDDDYYKKSLLRASTQLRKVKSNIAKLNSVLLKNISTFSTIIQANLPTNMAQIMNVTQMFPDIPTDATQNQLDNNIPITDYQMSLKLLFDIRQDIAVIYNTCSDVEIKGMFKKYRPRDDLCLRNVKNFLVSHVNFKQPHSGSINSSTSENADNSQTTYNSNLATTAPSDQGSLTNRDTDAHKLISEYMRSVYLKLTTSLSNLDESIDAWLWEKSCYFNVKETKEANKENIEGDNKENEIDPNNNPDAADESIKAPIVNLESTISNIQPLGVKENGATSELDPENNEKPPPIIHTNSTTTTSICDPIPVEQRGKFELLETAPSSHRFFNFTKPSMSNPKYQKAWKRDLKLLSTSLPQGVIVKSFDDRTDLFSLMIVGPDNTPYQHALFFFDMQLGPQYPTQPPSVFFHSMAPERVNPNLYTEGRVCLSLLGTWNGKGTENWDSKLSSLLQLIVSLQGLILVSEPYYNEAGFEIRRGSEEGQENSQRYNENAINNICQSMINLLHRPFVTFDKEINQHFKDNGQSLVAIHEYWASLDAQKCSESNTNQIKLPDFPLAPISRGFQLSLRRHLQNLQKVLDKYLEEWTDKVETATSNNSNNNFSNSN